MKPFDLEAAKRGEPIQTRDGRPAKFIAHVPDAHASQQVLVLIGEAVYFRYPTGRFHSWNPDRADILMAPRKRTVWVNLYYPYCDDYSDEQPASCWGTKEKAEEVGSNSSLTRVGNRAWPLEIEE